MGKNIIERKLITILSADVVGYSRLMSIDEEGTLTELKSVRAEILNPAIENFHGQVIKLMGDGILMQFNSVVDAVKFAVEFQRSMKIYNKAVSSNSRIEFRIGINIGDIIVEDGDIYGDGVNIAARLEGLADTGGVCVSGTVIDHIKGKLSVDFVDCGEQQVKNIPEKIRVFKFSLHDNDIPRSDNRNVLQKQELLQTVNETANATRIDLSLPDNPSIAVLPFNCMSSDPEQEFFSDGITEDIITALSKMDDLLVVARNSSFIYKGQAVDIKMVSRELGVRYVLEGSVRKANDRVRVTAQLIDATSGHHIWAERFDKNLEDIFDVQDEITREVIIALDVKLRGGEQTISWASGTKNLQAWECVRRGMDLLNSVSAESVSESEALFNKALQLDSEYAMAWVGLGWFYHHSVELGVSRIATEDRTSALQKAMEVGEKALNLDSSCADAYSLLSLCQLSDNEFDKALELSDKACNLASSNAEILGIAGIVHCKSGQPERALELIRKAMRCCPVYPGWFLQVLGTAYRLSGKMEEAISAYKTAIIRSENHLAPHVNLTSILGEIGRDEESRKFASEVLRIDPDFTIREYLSKTSYRDTSELQRIEKGLRAAGLPE